MEAAPPSAYRFRHTSRAGYEMSGIRVFQLLDIVDQTGVSCVARHGVLARNASRETDKAMLPPFWDYRREYDELRDEILARRRPCLQVRAADSRAGRDRVRARHGGLYRRQRRRRRQQRDGRDLHRAGGGWCCGRRRGHHGAEHGGADGGRDPDPRRAPGLCRHQGGRFPDGRQPGRGGYYAANQGDRSGASVRPMRRSRSP